MKYTDYHGWTKPYVIVHNTGFGVMEAPFIEHEVVAEANTWEEAVKMANKLKVNNNSAEDIRSSWVPNTYHINVNTNCDEGKALLVEFEKEVDKAFQKVIDNPDGYDTIKTRDGFTFHFQKTDLFDDPKAPTPSDLSMTFPSKIRYSNNINPKDDEEK